LNIIFVACIARELKSKLRKSLSHFLPFPPLSEHKDIYKERKTRGQNVLLLLNSYCRLLVQG